MSAAQVSSAPVQSEVLLAWWRQPPGDTPGLGQSVPRFPIATLFLVFLAQTGDSGGGLVRNEFEGSCLSPGRPEALYVFGIGFGCVLGGVGVVGGVVQALAAETKRSHRHFPSIQLDVAAR